MRFLFALLAALLLAAPAHAQSQDSDKVFDDLFGTEPARVIGTRGPRAGRDDLTIVALHLGRYQLVAWRRRYAYATAEAFCYQKARRVRGRYSVGRVRGCDATGGLDVCGDAWRGTSG